MTEIDTRSECDKPLEYPLCALCGRENVRCGHHWVYALPRGERGESGVELARRHERFARERGYIEDLIVQERLSPSMRERLGFEERRAA